MEMPTPATPQKPLSDYAVLRSIMLEQGLLKRQQFSFVLKMAEVIVLYSAAILFVSLANNLLLVLLSAAFLAFVFGQVGLLGHDAGHRQIFSSARKDRAIGQICSFLIGISYLKWVEKHNEHHAHPNREDMDPDIEFPVLAFSQKQAEEKRGIWRFFVRYQAIFFIPLLCLTSVSLRLNSFHFLLQKNISEAWVDRGLFALHFLCYFGLVFSLLTPLHAIIFIIAHQAFFGLYLGLIFAPNHKGMPVLPADYQIDFVREQVMTARNVRSNALIDFWYGGLNFQIEHHLFPTMPRSSLRRARTIIKKFCADKDIPYYETGMLRSYYEILAYMHSVSLFCRGSTRLR